MSRPHRYLREALDEINKIESRAIHAAALQALRMTVPHRIEMLPGEPAWFASFNCYAFALGVAAEPRYQKLFQLFGEATLADSAFVQGLIEDGALIETEVRPPRAKTIALYYKQDKLKHAGVIEAKSRRVRSKWGLCELYEHGLWEVGASYGMIVRYFIPPNKNIILDLLCKYLEVSEI